MQVSWQSLHGLAFGAVCTLGIVGAPSIAQASTITPSSFEATIGIDETVTVNKTIALDPLGATLIDVFFLADNTGSMSGVINTVKSVTSPLLISLEDIYGPANINFGVGRYLGDPSESGVTQFSAYDVLQPITDNNTLVQTGINSWFASGGGDLPEANLYALQQAATEGAPTPRGELSSGESTGWRAGAKKVIALFGDASGHQDSVDLNEAIDALQKEGVSVAAFNSTVAGFGIDSNFPDGRVAGNQASAIIAGAGGVLTNNFISLNSAQVQAAIVEAIGEVASTIDLEFLVDPVPAGVDVAWACTDPAGCTDVPGGASRSFKVFFTGTAPGTYAFETGFVGIAARESDRITVRGDEVPIPTPALLPGLIGMGVAALRKRGQGEGESAEA